MTEYIKREDALRNSRKMICTNFGGEFWDYAVVLCEDIEKIPAADVIELRHGEWMPVVIQEDYFEPPYIDTCKCSICGYEIDVSETVYNYCPNCGAQMGGRSEDNG